MLYRQSLVEELVAKREEFAEFGRAWAEQSADYAARLRALEGESATEVKRRAEEGVAAGAAKTPSALPGAELERAGSFVVPFARRWRTHDESRAWAVDALHGRVTFAADGSQLLPGRELSLPVAAVQVAWFENPHTRDGAQYRKEWDFSLITPRELAGAEGAAASLVGLRRFERELAAVRAFCERHRGWRERGERTPVAFFDGTLLLSIPRVSAESLQFPVEHINAVVETLKLSRETRVPVVGYTDQSYARDIVRLLDVLARRKDASASVADAQLFASAGVGAQPLFAGWGDRSVFCECLRANLPGDFYDDDKRPLVGFVYLQTTAPGQTPARLDIPSWIAEEKEESFLDDVLDAVRAECVVGNGYPYALETADEAAVITARDREQFLRAVQEFAEANDIGFRVSRKAISKLHRR